MTEIDIRDATTADIPALHRLIESAYRGEASRAGWTTEADLLDGQRTDPEELADILADPKQALLTAWRGEALVGCVLIADRGEATGYLGMLSVSPTLQGSGLGRGLVEAAHRGLAERFGARQFASRSSRTGRRWSAGINVSAIQRPARRCRFLTMSRAAGFRSETTCISSSSPVLCLDRSGAALHWAGMEIRTPRLTLRSARPDDLAAMHAVLSDPRATRWWSTPPHETLEQTKAWLDGMIANGPDHPDFVIELDGRVIGKAGFYVMPDIGYILHPDAWGRGLAAEAAAAAIDHVFGAHDVDILTADVDPENAASIRLLERLGFAPAGSAERTWNVGGEWKDSLYYALSRADRAAKAAAQAPA